MSIDENTPAIGFLSNAANPLEQASMMINKRGNMEGRIVKIKALNIFEIDIL